MASAITDQLDVITAISQVKKKDSRKVHDQTLDELGIMYKPLNENRESVGLS
jgi:hypothetical protein